MTAVQIKPSLFFMLHDYFVYDNIDYHDAIRNELIEKMGITPETTYLYIQGHHFFDKVVLPILNKICKNLEMEREREIERQAVHDTQRRNELSCYRHSVQDVEQMLKKNTAYMQSGPVRRLNEDIKKLF